jgi:hypothetical protein
VRKMSKRLGIAWLVLECLAIFVMAWSEFVLKTWSSVTHEDLSASPDALFQIRFFSWTSAVAMGVVMGLGIGAAMFAIATSKSPDDGAPRTTERAFAWLLAAVALVAILATNSLRHLPWLA